MESSCSPCNFFSFFFGIQQGMTPGMASLIMQSQVFFSMFFAAFFLGERSHVWQIIGALISFLGIGLVSFHLDASISLSGFIFVLAAAATWGYGNLITKKMKQVNMISLVVWSSFVASWPMLVFTLIFEGPASMMHSCSHFSSVGLIALLYIVYVSTWLGYGIWNWLIGHYPVGKIVPFSLLIPVVGMLGSILILGEPLKHWKIASGLLVTGGLCINLFGQVLFTHPFFTTLWRAWVSKAPQDTV